MRIVTWKLCAKPGRPTRSVDKPHLRVRFFYARRAQLTPQTLRWLVRPPQNSTNLAAHVMLPPSNRNYLFIMSADLKQRLKQIKKTLVQQTQAAPKPAPIIPPEPTDHELFLAATQGVVKLYRPARFEYPRAKPSPWPRQHEKDEAAVMADAMSDLWPWDELESGEELLFIRPGLKLETLRKLRRGEWVVQAQLDLHGMNSDSARLAVAEFLLHCRRTNKRCVRIIHGKGLGSVNREPVLKLKLKNWLAQRDEVLGFSQARAVDGGSGAVLVLLKGWRGK